MNATTARTNFPARVALIAAAALATTAVPAAGMEEYPPILRRNIDLAPGQAVVLRTNYGNVQIIETDGDHLELEVRRRWHDELHLQVEEFRNDLYIDAAFGAEPPSGEPSEWEVGYVLKVPVGTRIAVATGEGRVETRSGVDLARASAFVIGDGSSISRWTVGQLSWADPPSPSEG